MYATSLIITQLQSGGFVNVKDILSLKSGQKYTQDDVRRVVSNNAKQRFALVDVPNAPELRIRANQGHSMQVQAPPSFRKQHSARCRIF